MRKILIATPIKAGLESAYMAGLVKTLAARITDVQLEHAILGGTAVNFARNELLHYARSIGCGEIVFIDSDMAWRFDHFIRLISHVDLDVVGGLYCKRMPGRPSWNLNLKEGCEIDQSTGLLEVNDVGTGFMKIRLDTVCPLLEAKYPHLEYNTQTTNSDDVTCWEFFPLGVEGAATPAARLDKVKAALTTTRGTLSAKGELELLRSFYSQVQVACEEKHPPTTLRGEDYFFCHMARSVGCKIYADFGMPIVPHLGEIGFPIVPEMVGIDKRGELLKTDDEP